MSAKTFDCIETSRLELRRLKSADLDEYLDYLNDPVVARYQTWDSFPRERALEVIEEQISLSPGIPGAAFLFALELKDSNAFIGHVVLTVQQKDERQAEIGFTMAREHHGRGLAYEASSRVVEYAFSELKLHRLFAITDCENESSVKLLERLRMRREGHFIQNIWFKGKWGDEFLYAILAEEWARE